MRQGAVGWLAAVAVAAATGPAPAGYTVAMVPFAFEDITGTGTRVLAGGDDDTDVVAPLAPFPFFGLDYTDIYFSTNGLISLGLPNNSFGNTDLSASGNTFDLPTIAVLWNDLQFFQAGTDAVYAQAFADRTVIQWNAAGGAVSSPTFATFQAVLFATGDVRLNYANVTFGDFRDGGASATVGVRNFDGEFTQWSHTTASLTDETSLLFTWVPPPAEAVPAPPMLVAGLIGAAGLGVVRRLRRG